MGSKKVLLQRPNAKDVDEKWLECIHELLPFAITQTREREMLMSEWQDQRGRRDEEHDKLSFFFFYTMQQNFTFLHFFFNERSEQGTLNKNQKKLLQKNAFCPLTKSILSFFSSIVQFFSPSTRDLQAQMMIIRRDLSEMAKDF